MQENSNIHKQDSFLRKTIVKVASAVGLYKLGVKVDAVFKEKQLAKAFHKYGLDTLVEADKVVSSLGGKMFLCFGTLLGAYRDKGFIAHDCDLDVGLFFTERPSELKEKLEEAGFKLKRQFYFKKTNQVIEEQFDYKGVNIDFFYYFEDGDNCYCHITQRHESKDWRVANDTDGFPVIYKICPKSDFSRQSFLGHEFYMPTNTNEWLKSLYGEHFMTPDPKWSMADHKRLSVFCKERAYRR